MQWFESRLNPVFLVAEIGGNHEGDFEHAVRLTRLAAESGVDAVKFQIYEGETLVSRVEDPQRNAHFKRFELGENEYRHLAGICAEAGVYFMASIWSLPLIDTFDPVVSMHKVGSGDLTSYPILRRLAATGKPIILSTGLADIKDVRDAVDEIVRVDPGYLSERRLALLQCTSSYPCPPEDANLAAITTLRDTFGLPVGYSDHTIGVDAAMIAATMGAEILELHFTDQPEGRSFRDHQVSFTQTQIRTLLQGIRNVRLIQGSASKTPTASEEASQHVVSFRRSVYASRRIERDEPLSDLLPHEVVREEDLLPNTQ